MAASPFTRVTRTTRTLRRAAALAGLSAVLVVTACADPGSTIEEVSGTAAPARASTPTPAAPTGTTSATTPSGTGAAPQPGTAESGPEEPATAAKWAGTKQFMQIEGYRRTNGGITTYLKVRPAEKRTLGESFETVTVEGPWTEVKVSADAQNVPLRGFGGDNGQLMVMLKERRADQKDEGFDLLFNQKGEIRKITWLYA